MIYVYFFIKCVVRWSENSVRFENLMGIAFRWTKFCEILSHSVRYGMYELGVDHLISGAGGGGRSGLYIFGKTILALDMQTPFFISMFYLQPFLHQRGTHTYVRSLDSHCFIH